MDALVRSRRWALTPLPPSPIGMGGGWGEGKCPASTRSMTEYLPL
jgi:hypothetical protein